MVVDTRADGARGQVPKYLRIESDILSDIRDGTLKPGDKLPGQSEMRKRYGVSAITVRKAYADLVNAGYLVGMRGSGTFVARHQMIRGLTSISFSEELREQGYETKMMVKSVESAPNPAVAKSLDVDGAEPLTQVARVRLADGEPVVYQVSYVPESVLTLEQAQAIYETGSFYDTLELFGVCPTMVNETYSVRIIEDADICAALEVERGYPCFFVRRTAFDADNAAIEYSESFFNKDWYSVTVNIRA